MKVLAFIPVRGGSKSIPLKNIKPLCGKPLVCWCIEALQACQEVDEVVVATDSDAIWQTVEERHYGKVTLYRRSAENAADSASTESVMLEYIKAARLTDDTVFMLVQATSPLTQTTHFAEALQMYAQGGYDSIVTCVRNYRFFWRADGTSLNYDYRHRPRRQDFDGMLMENGAFYINTVKNIRQGGNRLSGRIGVYEMPDYTATEIDEPDDWTVLESIARRRGLVQADTTEAAASSAINGKGIRLFLTDVDGTLTDGGMYYSETGDELKKFNTRDGMGFSLLRRAGIKVGILTSEDRQLNRRRAEKLKVDFLRQGAGREGKLAMATDIAQELGISLREVAYIGDDINCMELLAHVGWAACPADAADEVKQVAGIHVMKKKGGEGCVREFIDTIILP